MVTPLQFKSPYLKLKKFGCRHLKCYGSYQVFLFNKKLSCFTLKHGGQHFVIKLKIQVAR